MGGGRSQALPNPSARRAWGARKNKGKLSSAASNGTAREEGVQRRLTENVHIRLARSEPAPGMRAPAAAGSGAAGPSGNVATRLL